MSEAQAQPAFRTEKAFLIAAGKTHPISIEMANTPSRQAYGLMFRQSMPRDHGMLFPYSGPPRILTMWMRNTILSLDMVFFDKTGKILHIERNTEPFSENIISSVYPASAVLELNAGVADELGLKPGDMMRHCFFNAPVHLSLKCK